jgi:transposase
MSGDNFARRYSVVTETRRRWSEAEKQAVVAEAERPGVNISAVARRHGIKPSLLFRWRRLARGEEDRQSKSAFIPVTLALPAPEAPALEVAAGADAPPASPSPAASREPDTQRIEIALGNGRVVRVGAGIDADSLRRILDAADGR